MKGSKKANLLIMGMAFLTTLGIVGSTMGTLSWYAYSTHTTLSYTGTSVRKSVLLNIGIYDPNGWISEDTIDAHHLIRDDVNDIVWTSSSTGLSELVINDYLADSGYATTELSPVTSNERTLVDASEFKLYASPEYGSLDIDEDADTHDYVKIPFAFKVVNNDNILVPNQNVWLTDVNVQTSGENLDKAVRIFFENKTGTETVNQFLLNPTDESDHTGATKVGGLLDLNGDELYDYSVTNDEEFIYGHYTGTPSYNPAAGPEGSDSDFDNINDTPYTSRASTFYAKHSKYAKTLDVSSVTFKEVEYETFTTVKPTQLDNGNYTGGKVVAHTSNDATAIGYTDITIYIEGWDHAIINTAAGYNFNLGLTFEINKI